VRISEQCAKCLYDKQMALTDNEEYLGRIKELIDNRSDFDTSPYMVYKFGKVQREFFGAPASYAEVKKKYNDLVLSMEEDLRNKIEASDDKITTALLYARLGNYIDFGAMRDVNVDTFLALFDNVSESPKDSVVIEKLKKECASAKSFLLLADNSGEIVLDKLFMEQLHKTYPNLELTVMVRGGEVLNDVTAEDAIYCGIDKICRIVSNGLPLAGTMYDLLSDEAKTVVDSADVILSKGQGNYESFGGHGRHAFYSFLCKCELFTGRFNVPRFTGIITEEL